MLPDEGLCFRTFPAGQPGVDTPEQPPTPSPHQNPVISCRDRVQAVVIKTQHGFVRIRLAEERSPGLDGTNPALRGL